MNTKDSAFPPSISLARIPTPIEHLERLSQKWGVKLLIKRDDLTGTVLTGNKVRKLEFFARAALDQGCDTLITCGGVQSNHARATAVVAAKLGLHSRLVLREAAESALEANLLLDRLVGAEIHSVTREEYFHSMDIMQRQAEKLADAGHRPYIIPEGGSNALGCFGYARAVGEIQQQLAEFPPINRGTTIITPVGSGGTLAGLLLGVKMFDLPVKVVGINVSASAAYFKKRVSQILDDVYRQFGVDARLTPEQIEVIDGYVGLGYARSQPAELKFIHEVAGSEGIILDPVYTGKTMYGLFQEIQKGRFASGQRLLFLHTGGIFGLFTGSLEKIWLQETY